MHSQKREGNRATLLAACLAGTMLASVAAASECAQGESEAALVTKNGSITLCVDDSLVENQPGGAGLALEAVECPCAEFAPSEREWSRMRDGQSCEDTGDALVIKAMKGGKGKRASTKELLLYVGDVGDVCAYQVYFDGVIHRNSYVLLDSSSVANACESFARDLYAAFAGSKREPASCPQ